LQVGEKVDLECKEAESEIPKSLWETYSAMANTNGGIIILRIVEDKKNGAFIVKGTKNPKKRVKDFWNTINGEKVNRNLLTDNDVNIMPVEDKEIIIINIPRANYKDKPIFLNGNPYKGTYKRNYEGDYCCTESEVKAMIRDSSDEGNDSQFNC
jgi:predicted HTH transcriptional regulator